MKTILLTIALLSTVSMLAVPVGQDLVAKRIELNSVQWRALLVATRHLQSRDDYTSEQQKVENYKVWINSEESSVRIDFIAIPRAGDEGMKGGNFDYAKSTSYIIASDSIKIVRVIGSR